MLTRFIHHGHQSPVHGELAYEKEHYDTKLYKYTEGMRFAPTSKAELSAFPEKELPSG